MVTDWSGGIPDSQVSTLWFDSNGLILDFPDRTVIFWTVRRFVSEEELAVFVLYTAFYIHFGHASFVFMHFLWIFYIHFGNKILFGCNTVDFYNVLVYINIVFDNIVRTVSLIFFRIAMCLCSQYILKFQFNPFKSFSLNYRLMVNFRITKAFSNVECCV